VRELLEVLVVCLVTLVLLSAAVAAGTAKWISDCYSSHAGEPVRWTFPSGCEVSYGGTFVTVGAGGHDPAEAT
jgi:hypothetical protein